MKSPNIAHTLIKKTIIISFILTSVIFQLDAQNYISTAQFRAYDQPCPLVIGQGFNILNPYKATMKCFDIESSNTNNLAPLSNAKKTSIKIFRTYTNSDYQKVREANVSGKVSFLNLFSFGLGNNSQTTDDLYSSEERIIIQASVNFGSYKFDRDLKLVPEAQELLSTSQQEKFIHKYGTHFISGIEKQNTLWIIISNKNHGFHQEVKNQNNANGGIDYPVIGLNFEANESEINNMISETDEYNVDIEAEGAEIDGSLQKKIMNILKEQNSNKLNEIKLAVSSAMNNLNSAEQAAITNYLYSSFDIYGLNAVKWDDQKENNLKKINEALIQLNDSRKSLKELSNASALEKMQNQISILSDFPEKTVYKEKIKSEYKRIKPEFEPLNNLVNLTEEYLKKSYTTCADLYCQSVNDCCKNANDLSKVNTLISKVTETERKLLKIINEANLKSAEFESKPECQKKEAGIINITSISTSPYDIYIDDAHVDILGGNQTGTYLIKPGKHQIKAVQKSGYLFYATINKRELYIETVCSEVSTQIGFDE